MRNEYSANQALYDAASRQPVERRRARQPVPAVSLWETVGDYLLGTLVTGICGVALYVCGVALGYWS